MMVAGGGFPTWAERHLYTCPPPSHHTHTSADTFMRACSTKEASFTLSLLFWKLVKISSMILLLQNLAKFIQDYPIGLSGSETQTNTTNSRIHKAAILNRKRAILTCLVVHGSRTRMSFILYFISIGSVGVNVNRNLHSQTNDQINKFCDQFSLGQLSLSGEQHNLQFTEGTKFVAQQRRHWISFERRRFDPWPIQYFLPVTFTSNRTSSLFYSSAQVIGLYCSVVR